MRQVGDAFVAHGMAQQVHDERGALGVDKGDIAGIAVVGDGAHGFVEGHEVIFGQVLDGLGFVIDVGDAFPQFQHDGIAVHDRDADLHDIDTSL